MMGEPGGMMGGPGGFGLGGSLLNILLLIALLAAAVWVAYKLLSGRDADAARSEGGADPAEGLLRERFARGEVGAEEYERSLRTLRGEQDSRSYEDFVRDDRERRT